MSSDRTGQDGLRVVDHRRASWFLLAEGDSLLLDVSCSHGAFGYSVLVELDDDERAALDRDGRESLDRLAHAIHFSAPAARGSTSPYRARDLTRTRRDDVSAAVRRWRGTASS